MCIINIINKKKDKKKVLLGVGNAPLIKLAQKKWFWL